jgi:hypothetical protein
MSESREKGTTRMRTRSRLFLGTLSAVVGLLALVPLANADYDPVGSGATKFSLDKDFLSLMAKNGVKVSAVAPAKLKGGVVTFPVTSGKFDPVSSKGTVEHEGALLFKAGGKSLPLKALQLKTTSKHTPFSVKAGGGQLKLGSAKSLVVSRSGFADKVKVTSLTLSTKVAGRLGKKLGLKDVFKGGLPLGQTQTTANPTTLTVLGKGNVAFNLDPGIVAKLNSLFVAANPIFPAEHVGPNFTLPIFGGTIAPDGSQGTIETQGAMELLQLGGGQVFWREPWIDLAGKALNAEADSEPSPPYPGKTGRVVVGGLTLTAPAVANPKAQTVAISGSLALDAATAASFNEVFAKPQGKSNVFAAGEALGSVSFTAQGQ